MAFPSPYTDADQSPPAVSTKSQEQDDWHTASSSPAGRRDFLSLLRAANACTGTSTVSVPLSLTHPRGKLRDSVFTVPNLQETGMRVQHESSPEVVESVRCKKRKVTTENSYSDQDGRTQSTEEEVVPVVKRNKKRGYRKATHTIRKEEIDHLRVELAQLQTQMVELQRRAFAPTREENAEDRELYTKVLHNAVKKHQEAFVEIQSAMTGYAACNIQAGSPIQRRIVLDRDEISRQETLRSMKALKLQDAREFFRRRISHLNPLKSLSEDYRFENDEGDYWAVRFATAQFEPAQSVKQIFDLVVYYLCNIEISVSEKMGHLTVREDDDSGEEGITQNRLVSFTGKGLHMESNTVVFSEYTAAGSNSQDGYGLIVAEFVDEDERHPYRPAERIRKDVNTVMEVTSYTRPLPTDRFGNLQEEKVVVLTRWSHSRLRHPNFAVRKDGWYELRENMDRWSQNMHNTIMESLDSSPNSSPTWHAYRI